MKIFAVRSVFGAGEAGAPSLSKTYEKDVSAIFLPISHLQSVLGDIGKLMLVLVLLKLTQQVLAKCSCGIFFTTS